MACSHADLATYAFDINKETGGHPWCTAPTDTGAKLLVALDSSSAGVAGVLASRFNRPGGNCTQQSRHR